jgi:small subunit ribosomal protein S20
MPITSSATKAIRSSAKKRVYNIRREVAIDRAMKDLKKLILAKDKKGAQALLPTIYQALDKAAKTGFIKKNTASRKKSRASAAVRKMG